jgi:hypothetical protein
MEIEIKNQFVSILKNVLQKNNLYGSPVTMEPYKFLLQY